MGWDLMPAALDDDGIQAVQGLVVATAQAVNVAAFSQRIGREIRLDELEAVNASSVELGRSVDAVAYASAVTELHAYTRRVTAWWADYDLLLLPTITDPPPRLGEVQGDGPLEDLASLAARFGWLTPPWNITGQPAVSLPAHWNDDGLPIGVQLVAAPGREDQLIQVASQLEPVLGWLERGFPTQD